MRGLGVAERDRTGETDFGSRAFLSSDSITCTSTCPGSSLPTPYPFLLYHFAILFLLYLSAATILPARHLLLLLSTCPLVAVISITLLIATTAGSATVETPGC